MRTHPGFFRRLVAVAPVLAAAALLLPAVQPSTPAMAASCPEAGGDPRPFSAEEHDDADVVLAGGGWGHGVGMSQYGAKGAALLGCTYLDILTTYYPGSSIGVRDMPETVRVGLTSLPAQSGGGATATVTADGGAVAWELAGCADDAEDACRVQPPEQPEGATWRIRAIRQDRGDADTTPDDENVAADGAFRITDAASGDEIWRGGDRFSLLSETHEGLIDVAAGGVSRTFRWGHTRLDSYAEGDGKLFVVHHVTSAPDGSATGMQRYLWGLAEIPASWPGHSLRAQALAGRSYALKRIGLTSREQECRCDLYATVRDQHYQGWDYEAADRAAGGRWKDAVDATAGEIVEYEGAIVDAFYSSSHGGSSESSVHVWGGDVPYLQAVDTSRWEQADGVDNPRQRWSVGFTVEELGARFGMAEFTSLEIVERGPGGRPTRVDSNGDGQPDGVRVTGRDGRGTEVTRWLSGEQLRSTLSLYSSLVEVRSAPDNGDEPSIDEACPPERVPDHRFSDVPSGSVHRAAIDCMAWWEVVQGVDEDRYAPLDHVRRDQMASFIARAIQESGGALPDDPPDRFADDDGNYHETAINRLAAADIVRGRTNDDGEDVYEPAQLVHRDQMAAFLVRAYEFVAERELENGDDAFSDDDGNTHERDINKAHAAAIVAGKGESRYAPRERVQRDQMASFLARMLNGLVEEGVAEPPPS